MSDNLSGVWVQRKYSVSNSIWIKTNKAPWADQKGRCGVRRVNHVEREHFSLSAGQEDKTQKDPEQEKGESSEFRCVRDSLSVFKAAAAAKPYTGT